MVGNCNYASEQLALFICHVGALVISEVTLGTSLKSALHYIISQKRLRCSLKGEGKTKDQKVDPLEQGIIAGVSTVVDA
jgi:hypothetical protein